MLKRQDREGGRSRQWRSNFKRLQRELLQLEEDEQLLDSVFPQVRSTNSTLACSTPCRVHCTTWRLLSATAGPTCCSDSEECACLALQASNHGSLRLAYVCLSLQGQDGEVRWVMYQLGYIATGLLGVIGVCVSGCWLAHIITYMLPPVPIHPLLNDVFIKLDGVFPLFGVAAFAAFCAYLMGE